MKYFLLFLGISFTQLEAMDLSFPYVLPDSNCDSPEQFWEDPDATESENEPSRPPIKPNEELSSALDIIADDLALVLPEQPLPDAHQKNNEFAIVEGRYVCLICQRSYARREHLTRHKRVHADPQFCCPICGKKFHRKDHLKDHERDFHSDDRSHKCLQPECGKTYRQPGSLWHHQRSTGHSGKKHRNRHSQESSNAKASQSSLPEDQSAAFIAALAVQAAQSSLSNDQSAAFIAALAAQATQFSQPSYDAPIPQSQRQNHRRKLARETIP